MTSETTGLNLNRTIITTTATIATAVLMTIAVCDMGAAPSNVCASGEVSPQAT